MTDVELYDKLLKILASQPVSPLVEITWEEIWVLWTLAVEQAR